MTSPAHPAPGTKLRIRSGSDRFGVVTGAQEDRVRVLLWPSAATCSWTWSELPDKAEVLAADDPALPSDDHWSAVAIIGRLFVEVDTAGGELHIPQHLAADIVRRAQRAMRDADAQYLAPAVSLLLTCPVGGMRIPLDDADELAEAVGVAPRLARASAFTD